MKGLFFALATFAVTLWLSEASSLHTVKRDVAKTQTELPPPPSPPHSHDKRDVEAAEEKSEKPILGGIGSLPPDHTGTKSKRDVESPKKELPPPPSPPHSHDKRDVEAAEEKSEKPILGGIGSLPPDHTGTKSKRDVESPKKELPPPPSPPHSHDKRDVAAQENTTKSTPDSVIPSLPKIVKRDVYGAKTEEKEPEKEPTAPSHPSYTPVQSQKPSHY